MQIRPEDQPDETTGARTTRGSSSPTEPIATSSSDRTAALDRTQALDRGALDRSDLDDGVPTRATPTPPVRRSRSARKAEDAGPDYSNWYDSELYVSEDEDDDAGERDDASATRPIGTVQRDGRDGRGGGDDLQVQRDTTAPQPISSERTSWYQQDPYQDGQDGQGPEDDRAGGRYDVEDDRAAVTRSRPHRTGIAAKLGLLVLGLLLAVIAAALLGMNGQAAVDAVRPGGPAGTGLLPLLGFGAGVLGVLIILVCGRTSSTAPLMGSLVGLPALAGMLSGDAAALVRDRLISWSVPAPIAEAFVRPETALAGVLLFLIGIAFSTRRRAEDHAGPVSSFFLGLFSAICFVPGLLLFALATQEALLRSFAQAGWPSSDITRPVALVLGIILMAIGVACTSRAPGGMVVSGVLALVAAAAVGFVFLGAPTVLPAGAADVVTREVTVTAPLLALLAGLSVLVASFAGLSLGRDTEPTGRY